MSEAEVILNTVEEPTEPVLHPKQVEAIDACCDIKNRIVTVNGAAGTGKTTILKKAFKADQHAGWNPALCAPTGKAAKRIFEATGIEASTIHRLLEYSHPGDPDPKTGKPIGVSAPRRTRQNPLEVDVVYVDEAMMANKELYRGLIDALPNSGRIRFFGDLNQLDPIEEDKNSDDPSPAPFVSLINNPKFASVTLEQVFRQGQDSGILLNANGILKGRYPTNNEQWKQVYTEKPIDVLRDYILDQHFEHNNSFATIENQIIVPQKKGWLGTVALNTMVQSLFHNEEEDPTQPIKLDRHNWDYGEGGIRGDKGGKIKVYLGDKVIITQNLYELGVFNGESGVVIEINHETGEVVVDFGDREQSIPPLLLVQNSYGGTSEIDPRRSLALGYVITTHKSQGSEYKHVIYMATKTHTYMLNRRNFYTGITRAREHVFLICDQRGMAAACSKRG